MDVEENIDLDGFLFALLGKRKRRKDILYWWHSKRAKNAYETTKDFVDHVLHEPIQLSFHTDFFCIFGDFGFAIYYEWLNKRELCVISQVFAHRRELFRNVSTNLSGSFFMTDCRVTVVLEIHNRRELVRDYCFMGIAHKALSKTFRLLLCNVTQELLLRKNADEFLRQLHFALQGHKSIEDLICVF